MNAITISNSHNKVGISITGIRSANMALTFFAILLSRDVTESVETTIGTNYSQIAMLGVVIIARVRT
jgi:hypothetical protein